MWYFGTFGWNLKKKLLSFSKQYPRIFQYATFHAKIKNTYVWDKKCFISVFLDWNSKNHCHI